MKHLSVVLAALGVLFVCAGCSDTPREVAGKWAQAIAAGDVKTANECSTGKTYPVNAVLCALMSSKQADAAALAEKFRAGIAGFASAQESIDGDIATLTVPGEEAKFILRRVDGMWKVDRADMLPVEVKAEAAVKVAAAKADAAAKSAAAKADAAAKAALPKTVSAPAAK